MIKNVNGHGFSVCLSVQMDFDFQLFGPDTFLKRPKTNSDSPIIRMVRGFRRSDFVSMFGRSSDLMFDHPKIFKIFGQTDGYSSPIDSFTCYMVCVTCLNTAVYLRTTTSINIYLFILVDIVVYLILSVDTNVYAAIQILMGQFKITRVQ